VRRLLALAAAAIAAASCGDSGPTEIQAPARLSLTSPAFAGAENIPTAFTCDGTDVSPPLQWEAQAEEFVLTMTDPDAGDFVHWVVYSIPGHVTELAEGELPAGAVEGVNDTEELGYGGPCPPGGDTPHRYELTLYALNRAVTSDLGEGASLDEVLVPIECCVASKGTLTGTYGR
jgi:Raf kinase inhibitor-like YbhB/YbcL family protein